MSTSPASFLRLHLEPPPDAERPLTETLAGLGNLCRAFESALGWRLSCEPRTLMNFEADQVWTAPITNGNGEAGQLCLRRKADEAASVDTANASRLAAAIGELISGRLAAETALWQREAELASCVPVVTRPDEAEHLAERLEGYPVRLTQLAHGLPVGGELDYLDEGTLAQALRARRPVG